MGLVKRRRAAVQGRLGGPYGQSLRSGANAQARTARTTRDNVRCQGQSGRTSDMAGESVHSQKRKFAGLRFDWNQGLRKLIQQRFCLLRLVMKL